MKFDLGRTIRITRAACGISQADLAKSVGVHESAVSRYESGTRVPSLEQVDALAAALGMSFDLFVEIARAFGGGQELPPQLAQLFSNWLTKKQGATSV